MLNVESFHQTRNIAQYYKKNGKTKIFIAFFEC